MNYYDILYYQWHSMGVLLGDWRGTPQDRRKHIDARDRLLKHVGNEWRRYEKADRIIGTWYIDGEPEWLTDVSHHIVIRDGKAYRQYYNIESRRRPQVFLDSQGRIPGDKPGAFFHPKPGELDRFDASSFGQGALVLHDIDGGIAPLSQEWRHEPA